jgi:hypothetical protein
VVQNPKVARRFLLEKAFIFMVGRLVAIAFNVITDPWQKIYKSQFLQ